MTSIETTSQKLVTFHQLVPGAPLPRRADRSRGGSLPTRAFRYCKPVTRAAGFGYYVCSPVDFSLLWDGVSVSCMFPGDTAWMTLGAAPVPGFPDYFDRHAPDSAKGCSPPLVSAIREPGLVQVWSGLVARTAPGVSLLLRAPVNVPHPGGYEVFDGIVEGDRWFGPLFGVVRLTRTDRPIVFSTEYPLFQVQPLPRTVYADAALENYELVPELSQMSVGDWRDYHAAVVQPDRHPPRSGGHDAAGRRNGDPNPV